MSDSIPKVPHFLRVVRALARVRGAALPLAAIATTVVAGAHCSAPYEGGPVGDVAMPDGGYDGGPVGLPAQDAGSDASDGGTTVGVGIMPDAGDGG